MMRLCRGYIVSIRIIFIGSRWLRERTKGLPARDIVLFGFSARVRARKAGAIRPICFFSEKRAAIVEIRGYDTALVARICAFFLLQNETKTRWKLNGEAGDETDIYSFIIVYVRSTYCIGIERTRLVNRS